MAKVAVNDTTLTSIADAIREKNGLDVMYKPSEMPDAIRAIVGNTEYEPGTGIDEIISENLDATSLYIPASCADEDGVLYVGRVASKKLTSLKKLVFGEGITKIIYSGGTGSYYPFDYLEECKIIFPSTLKEIHGGFDNLTPKDGILEFPEGLEVVENSAFGGLSSCTIIIPSTIKRIGTACFTTKDYDSYNIYIKGKPDVIKFDENAFFDNYYPENLDDDAAYQYFFVSWAKSALTIPTSLNRTITYSYNFTE